MLNEIFSKYRNDDNDEDLIFYYLFFIEIKN